MQNICSALIRKGGTVLYLTVCQQLKHLSKDEFLILRELCRTTKNLTNQAIYQIWQHYFEHSQYLQYEKNYAILKTSENYRLLNSNMPSRSLRKWTELLSLSSAC